MSWNKQASWLGAKKLYKKVYDGVIKPAFLFIQALKIHSG